MLDIPVLDTRIPSIRISPSNEEVLRQLSCLRDLAGTWEGEGFNLIARPDFEGHSNLFLQLNLTKETLKFDPISSSIPNRGSAQDDIELFGLTYLQKISDANPASDPPGGALHIEPGIWVTVPKTGAPEESRSIVRMGSIPHGNALLAEGTCGRFEGPPTLSPGANPVSGGNPAFSIFPSFNSTPFRGPTAGPAGPGGPAPVIAAAGTSENGSIPGGGFSQYTLAPPPVLTPPGTRTSPIPPSVTQDVINDPIRLLQQAILKQQEEGYEFEGSVLNIATKSTIQFATTTTPPPPPAPPPTVTVTVHEGGGGAENIHFLRTNADTALVYATFWIEKVRHRHHRSFMQLQYAQMVILNFPAIELPGNIDIGWPHISVATLRKTFG